jgi:AcrR family transcriptional regulator
MGTKNKIITTATEIFNQRGFMVSTLQDIANDLGISRGNLRYHFKDKDILLHAIVQEMWDKIKRERSKSREYPTFANLHNEVQLYYKFQQEYSFIFLDTHVLNHPVVREQFREMTEHTISDNEAALAFAMQAGNLKPEAVPGTYHNIAFITWMLTFYWLSQQIIRGEKTKEDGEKLIWSMLIPHFTEKGVLAFKNYFGEEYFNSLGEPFKANSKSLLMF